MIPVAPSNNPADVVARQTRPNAFGPDLPDRSRSQERQAVLAVSEQPAASQWKPPITVGQWLPPRDQEEIWFVVSRAARLHASPSVSSPTVHFYAVGIELKVIGHEQGWLQVSDPATAQQGWIFERYYLQAIRGPGHAPILASANPAGVVLAPSNPRPLAQAKKPNLKQKAARPNSHHVIRIAREDSVFDLMYRGLGGY
jgi:hypothetical protein